MSFYSENLRENGRNNYDWDVADELDRLETLVGIQEAHCKRLYTALIECECALTMAASTEAAPSIQAVRKLLSELDIYSR